MATKEVDFLEYCPLCVHYNEPDDRYPCDDCLAHPWNTDSHKPVEFVAKPSNDKKGANNA